MPDWFEKLFGFVESGYDETRRGFSVNGEALLSVATGRQWSIGRLETPRVQDLRERVHRLSNPPKGRLRVMALEGNIRDLHAQPEAEGALVQVASQFNLLEMTDPDVCPEDGITRYAHDRTQGPACALAAAPATVYRNYFAPVNGSAGQTRDRQIDCLADVAAVIPGGKGFRMANGYADANADALGRMAEAIRSADDCQLDDWRGLLRIGLHHDVEVVEPGPATGQRLSQAFCSALPVSYSSHRDAGAWAPIASLVLEAAYEATLLAAVENAARRGRERVYLTQLGGGAFGNDLEWIGRAIRRGLGLVTEYKLDAILVCYNGVDPLSRELAEEFA